jgi:DNA-binding transcriptional LysR family regulator
MNAMIQKRNILPPLDYLLAFESASYCQSFAGASRELNISETAISRKVRLLELHYDIPLFIRGHRSITLTPQGHTLREKILPALEILRDTSREMLTKHKNNSVTLAATNSVASFWLMPKLRKFNRSNKHLKIMLVASDNDQECLADTVDLAILRGDGNWENYHSKLLFGEIIFPVCTPEYLEKHPKISDITVLAGSALIEISNEHAEWMNWKTWLAEHEIERLDQDQTAVFNTYPLAIQAAMDGHGVALGWGHMVDHMLDTGKLVRPLGNLEIQTNSGYYLLQRIDKQDFPERKSVEDWLLQESGNND